MTIADAKRFGKGHGMPHTKKGAQPQNTSACECVWHTSQNCYCKNTREDCKEVVHPMKGISAQVLLANQSYDTNDILTYAVSAVMQNMGVSCRIFSFDDK